MKKAKAMERLKRLLHHVTGGDTSGPDPEAVAQRPASPSASSSKPRKVWYAPYKFEAYGEEEIEAVTAALRDGWLAPGPRTDEFEAKVCELFGKRHGIMVNSGSSGNIIGLAALGLQRGDEVITPACTFATCIAPLEQLGLTPVFVDVVPNRYVPTVGNSCMSAQLEVKPGVDTEGEYLLLGLLGAALVGGILLGRPRPKKCVRSRKGRPSGMEPTAEELNTIDTLDAAYDWSGVAQDARTALNQSLGGPTKIRDIIFIGRQVWDTVVARTKGKGPANPDGSIPDRDLTAVDLARLEIFRRVCFKRVGVAPDTPGTLGPPAAAPSATMPASVTSAPSGRKLKMSAIVDQTLDAEIQPLTTEAVNKMYEEYRKKYGDVPQPQSEPTSDQLAAVQQLLSTKSAPYIDFAVYGPNGLRLLRKLTFQSISLNAQGEWQRRELPGPPDWEAWHDIFRVVRTTFLLLEAMTAERLDAYAEHVRQLAMRFGNHCWDLVYTADVHMRSEQFERIRRHLHAHPAHGYTDADPWNAVFAQAIKEDSFWAREVITPATLRLAQAKSIPAPLTPHGKPQAMQDADRDAGQSRKKRKKEKGAADKPRHDGKETSDTPGLTAKAKPPSPPRAGEGGSQPSAGQQKGLAGERYGCWSSDPANMKGRPRKAIIEDIVAQYWDAIYLGTPCETYSALREIQPGPRPLRSPNELSGIKKGLSTAEKKQLQEGNEHTDFSAEVMTTAHGMYTPFTVENPEPLNPVTIFNMPSFKSVAGLRGVSNVNFDQCNHEPKTFKDADGKEYRAAHERVAQRRRTTAEGGSEFASKALGNYHPTFCKRIAVAISKVNMERAMRARELREEPLP
eukprot:s347_g31.t1